MGPGGLDQSWAAHCYCTIVIRHHRAVGIECASPAGRNLFSSYQERIRRQGRTLGSEGLLKTRSDKYQQSGGRKMMMAA